MGFNIVGPKTTIPFYLAFVMSRISGRAGLTRATSRRIRRSSDYPEPEREVAKLAKLIAEIHAKKINPYAY